MADLNKIKVFAAEKGINMNELAVNSGITPAALHKLIRNNSTKIDTLECIAKNLGVSIHAFFDESSYVDQSVDLKKLIDSNALLAETNAKLTEANIKLTDRLLDSTNSKKSTADSA